MAKLIHDCPFTVMWPPAVLHTHRDMYKSMRVMMCMYMCDATYPETTGAGSTSLSLGNSSGTRGTGCHSAISSSSS